MTDSIQRGPEHEEGDAKAKDQEGGVNLESLK